MELSIANQYDIKEMPNTAVYTTHFPHHPFHFLKYVIHSDCDDQRHRLKSKLDSLICLNWPVTQGGAP